MLYRFSGFSSACLLAQVVLPLAGSPMSIIISQSSRFSTLLKSVKLVKTNNSEGYRLEMAPLLHKQL